MTTRNWISSAAVVILALGGTSPVQAELVMDPTPAPNRYVGSAATSGVTDATISGGGTSSAAFGTFGLATSTTPPDPGPIGTSSSSATHLSTTPLVSGGAMGGGGTALASVDWDSIGPPDGGFSVMADSFFDVFFEVDVPGNYNLTGVVDSGGTFLPGTGVEFAFVQLDDVTNVTTIFLEDTNPGDPGPDSFGTLVTLSPGISYRLTARAFISRGTGAPTTASADASWDFLLAEDAEAVPEPATFVLGLLGLAGVGRIAGRRRRRA